MLKTEQWIKLHDRDEVYNEKPVVVSHLLSISFVVHFIIVFFLILQLELILNAKASC